MRAAVCDRYGPPEVLRVADVPIPEPGPGEVRVRVHAAGLNALDWHVVRADPFFVRLDKGLRRPKFSGPGAEVAGVVDQIGAEVTSVALGDEVIADISGAGLGGLSQWRCLPVEVLVPKPAGTTFVEAAGLPLAGGTALRALREAADVQPGERVLVHGASGGVGTFAIQIAKILGAHVTALCSGPRIPQARELGADEVLDRAETDLSTTSLRWDVVLGVNGHQPLSTYRRILAPGGRYAMVGGTYRQIFGALFLGRLYSTGGRTLRPVVHSASPALVADLASWAAEGRLRTVVERTYPLEEAAAALAAVDSGHSGGKIIVTLGPDPDRQP